MNRDDIGVLELIRSLCVLAALVGLTVFLAMHYDDDEKKVAAVLGIAAPVLGAIVGASIGYSAGKVKGKEGQAEAVKDGRRKVIDHLSGLITGGGAEAIEDPRLGDVQKALDALKTE